MTKPAIAVGLLKGAAIVAMTAALAACGSGGGHSAPPPVVTHAEDFFGTQFGIDFRAAANSQPVVPAATDIIPLSLTTQPQTNL